MIISVNWLKKFVSVDLSVEELAARIGARLVEIEEVIDLGAKYKDVVVARVAACAPVEGSDHLNKVLLDDNGAVKDVERDESGYVQVVCGAPNVREGLIVAWLPPGATVPETFGDKEPFVLGARKLRGVLSNGMIASPRELALSDEHEGILELPADALGRSFVESLEFDDHLLDIENKSLTHRPDTFGVIGFAREVAGIQGKQFMTPDWLQKTEPAIPYVQVLNMPRVSIDDPELSHRYQIVALQGVDCQKQSPLLLQSYLNRVGIRPLNAVVDVTNYLMLETGQPLHAFDYDKVMAIAGEKKEIHVRAGREGEKLTLLDGRTIELSNEDIVIAAGDTPISLAGAMGGADTEIDVSTTRVLLESATFNLYNLRATQMRHGIFSEAITRFTKGQPAALTAPVLAKAVEMLHGMSGAEVASVVAESYPVREPGEPVQITVDRINAVLGSRYGIEEIIATLRNVEFEVQSNDGTLSVTPPFWRADIHIPEDVIEEIGRLNGFDSLVPVLPERDFIAVQPTFFDQVRSETRRIMARAGANEVLTYNFVHGNLLKKALQDPAHSYRITNSISPDLQYYRQTLTPSLLSLVHSNSKSGYDDFALFELNKTHDKRKGMDHDVPSEQNMLASVVSRKKGGSGAPYYQAKRLLEYLASSLGVDFSYAPLEADAEEALSAPFERRRSFAVTDRTTGIFLGIVGEFKQSVKRDFKLPDFTAGFEVDMVALAEAVKAKPSPYAPISRFPGTERDLCFQVETGVSYGGIESEAKKALKDVTLETHVEPVDFYQATDSTTKNVTIRVRMVSFDKTLSGDEASAVALKVANAVCAAFNARVV